MSFAGIQGEAQNQYLVLSSIPGRSLMNWSSAVSFGIVDYLTLMIVNALPDMGGGAAGTAYAYFVNGMRDVIKQVTWDVTKR